MDDQHHQPITTWVAAAVGHAINVERRTDGRGQRLILSGRAWLASPPDGAAGCAVGARRIDKVASERRPTAASATGTSTAAKETATAAATTIVTPGAGQSTCKRRARLAAAAAATAGSLSSSTA